MRAVQIKKRLIQIRTLKVLASLGVRLAGSLITLLMNFVLIRMVGTEEAGFYMLAFTLVTVMSAAGRCGTESVVLKHTAAAEADGRWGEANSVYAKSMLLVFGASVILTLTVFASAKFIAVSIFDKAPMEACLKFMGPGILLLGLSTTTARALQGFHRINLSMFVLNIGTNLGIVILLLAVRPASAEAACLLYVVAGSINFAIAQLSLQFIRKTGEGSVSWRRVLHSAWLLWTGVVVETLVRLAGPLIAGIFVSGIEVAQLTIAQRLSVVVSIALTAATQHATPLIAKYWRAGDIQGIRETTRHAGRLSCLLAMPIVIPMLLVPEFILGLFSEDIAGGALLLRIIALGQVVNVCTGPVSFLLQMCDLEIEIRNARIAAGAFAIVGGFVITWAFGAVGAAASTSISIAMLMLLAAASVKKHLGFHPIAILFERSS